MIASLWFASRAAGDGNAGVAAAVDGVGCVAAAGTDEAPQNADPVGELPVASVVPPRDWHEEQVLEASPLRPLAPRWLARAHTMELLRPTTSRNRHPTRVLDPLLFYCVSRVTK